MQPRFGLGVLNKLSELRPAIQVLFLRFLWIETKSRPIKTSLINKGFLIWHKEKMKKMVFVLVYF